MSTQVRHVRGSPKQNCPVLLCFSFYPPGADPLEDERPSPRDGATLRDALERNGFEVEHILDFNRVSVPAWWWNGRVLKRRHLGRLQLKLLNVLVGAIRLVDPWLPWGGVSLIAVGRRLA